MTYEIDKNDIALETDDSQELIKNRTKDFNDGYEQALWDIRAINTKFYKEFGNTILFHWWFDRIKELEKKQ